MKTVALIDTHLRGHHLMYLRFISKTLLEMGHKVIGFYPKPDQLASWISAECPEQIHRFKALPIQEPPLARLPILGRLPQPFNVRARWQHAATIAKIAAEIGKPPDLFFFNWLDDQLSSYLPHQLIDQIFPYPWTGICFKPRLPLQSFVPERKGLFDYHEICNADQCCGVNVLDEKITEILQQRIRNPVITFPDFTDESVPDPDFWVVQKLQQQAQGRKIIGLLGALNKRKGLLTLLETALQPGAENWFFAFVGQLSTYTMLPEEQERLQAIVASAPPNCFFHFELIPDEPQFNALVAACDVLFAAYEGFPYSSNILTKAAVFSKPVIASEGFCMGDRVKQFQLGLTITEGNIDDCIAALRNLCNFSSSDYSFKFKPDFAGYRQRHSITQVRTAFQEILVNV
jgi:glycosyltransferase involved in cell wall biosynthesis